VGYAAAAATRIRTTTADDDSTATTTTTFERPSLSTVTAPSRPSLPPPPTARPVFLHRLLPVRWRIAPARSLSHPVLVRRELGQPESLRSGRIRWVRRWSRLDDGRSSRGCRCETAAADSCRRRWKRRRDVRYDDVS
jgi:hypothetical protein